MEEEKKEEEDQKKPEAETPDKSPVESPNKLPTSSPTEPPKSPEENPEKQEEKKEGKSKIVWIGAILIIAVIGMAGIYSFFVRPTEQTSEEVAENAAQIMEELQAEVEESAVNQMKCSGSRIDIISVAEDLVVVRNSGLQTITDISCAPDNGETFSVVDGGFISGDMASADFIRGDSASITCTGKCLTVEVSGDCEEGQSCWK